MSMKPQRSPIESARDIKKADQEAMKLTTRIAFGLRPWDEEMDERDLMHEHRCQQCDKLLASDCRCDTAERMGWCSARCRAAFDL